MDLFDYAQALFNEEGHLWVPGLGHFYKKRKSSYYDTATNTMHPPGYEVAFDEKSDNTDTAFISYFSKVKNLSQGSAKYFVDKFVENVKDELRNREVTFALLGTLYTVAESQIAFRGNKTNSADESGLFGLAPVQIEKLTSGHESTEEQQATPPKELPEEEQTLALPASDTNDEEIRDPEEVNAATDNDIPADENENLQKRAYNPHNFYTDDRVLVLKGKQSREQRSTRYQFWILAGLVAIIVILGIYLVTQNLLDPANSSNVSSQIMDKNGGRKDTVVNVSKAKADSALIHNQENKPLPNAVDTNNFENPLGSTPGSKSDAPDANAIPSPGIPKGSWVVSGGQNNNYDAATATLSRFRKMGYPEARMIDSVKQPGYFVYKIIFGYYNTRKEAAGARQLLLKENKLKPKVLKVQQYK